MNTAFPPRSGGRFGQALLLPVSLALLATLVTLTFLTLNEVRSGAPKSRETDLSAIRAFLASSPFDGAAHRALAYLGLRSTDFSPRLATASLDSAIFLAPHDPQSLRLTAYRHFQNGRIEPALDAVQRLAGIDGDEQANAFTALDSVSALPVWESRITKWADEKNPLLASYASWNCNNATTLPTKLWVATQASRVKLLSSTVLECLFAKVGGNEEIVALHALWLETLPQTALEFPYLYNGNFEIRDAAPPFSWKLSAGGEYRDGHSTKLTGEKLEASVNRFLQIDFNGKPVKTDPLVNHTVLAAGNYTFSYRIRDAVSNPTLKIGLAIDCAAPARRLAGPPEQSDSIEDGRGWRRRTFSFQVPENCFAQRIVLDSTARNWRTLGISGRLSIDDVVIANTGMQ